MKELDHKFGDDGMFWISFEDLLQKYSSFERTRLFDRSWTITQQWTTVDVPWSADYNDTKFTVTITKQSPVVIVLSQLDDRYFKGFQGQYTFQLHFRLDKDGEEDYIVRSHGNYSMSRSVSTDLELEPGTYSVLMRITARRWTGNKTVEDVVRESCKNRPNKLIQIGLSYDLAHAKGEIVETEEDKEARLKLEESQKAANKKKQRQDLSVVQKKQWERKKREKAREKRKAKQREEYQRKKAEKQEVVGKTSEAAPSSLGPAEGATVASGIEGEVEKQAAAGAQKDMTGKTSMKDGSIPNPPAEIRLEEPTSEAKSNGIPPMEATTKAEDNSPETSKGPIEKSAAESTKAEQFEKDLQAIPSIIVNGDPSPQAQAGSTLAPPSVPASVAGADDDYLYDSDASFHSSIDSVLDFPEDPSAIEQAGSPGVQNDGNDDSDAEVENDPWNAVCVVGLRVYSKDEGCCIKVVRPRTELGDEEAGLEIDDVSKGVSQEKEEGKEMRDGDVKAEVKTGIED